MNAIPSIQDNPDGLHRRYDISKLNGEPVDPLATYFVLRLDNHGRDAHHIDACRDAALAYCDRIDANPDCSFTLRRMAEELRTLVENFKTMDF